MTIESERREWHLDKKLTLSIIMVLIANTVAFIWNASALWNDVDNLTGVPAEMIKLREDVIRLQEHDKLMDGTLGDLARAIKENNALISKFGNEQSRRKPIVDRAERELFNGHSRKGKTP